MNNAPQPAPQKSWRDVLPVHPAADLFPPLKSDELRELGEDIKKNGLREPIILWAEDYAEDPADTEWQVLDGRNRLDAMEMVGLPVVVVKDRQLVRQPRYLVGRGDRRTSPVVDPYEYVLSANIHRRHLTAEQKREIIAKVIKAQPEKSDRQIAKIAKASPTTVGTVRAKMEAGGDVSKLDTRTDTRGRKQPATKPTRRSPEAVEANRQDREARKRAKEEEDYRRKHDAAVDAAARKILERFGLEEMRWLLNTLDVAVGFHPVLSRLNDLLTGAGVGVVENEDMDDDTTDQTPRAA
jgi:ParB-like nuclease domain